MASQMDTQQILDEALRASQVKIINVHQFYPSLPTRLRPLTPPSTSQSRRERSLRGIAASGSDRGAASGAQQGQQKKEKSRFMNLGHNTTELDDGEPLGDDRHKVCSSIFNIMKLFLN